MGLNCSHGAFDGAYSSFNRLRQFVAAAAGGSSFPPHYIYEPDGSPRRDATGRTLRREDMFDGMVYFAEGYTPRKWPGLHEFLGHSDCDGYISPSKCTQVADDLERLMPQMEALGWRAQGHLSGGYVPAVQRFVDGCRAAAAARQRLTFG